jgi:YebC/PmpR family DNA-binding regulatory protein
VAAKNGGADPSMNLKLRYAIDKARSFSCPKDNIERSIKKATGEAGADTFEEVMYEGYGPGGVAVMCSALTDNRNRTAGDVRRIFDVCGGNLGSTGSVSYLFNFKGIFVVEAKHVEEERLFEVALEAGADDISHDGDYFEVTSDPKAFEAVRKALEDARIPVEEATIGYIPTTTVELDVENGRRMRKLLDLLEENEDVQDVYSNDQIPEEAFSS